MRALLLVLTLALAGCGGSPLSFLTGGGPNVAANVQAGQTNSQTIGTTTHAPVTQRVEQADTVKQSADRNEVRTEQVEHLVVNKGIPTWWIIGLVAWSIFLWQLPSPNEIGRKIGWTKNS